MSLGKGHVIIGALACAVRDVSIGSATRTNAACPVHIYVPGIIRAYVKI